MREDKKEAKLMRDEQFIRGNVPMTKSEVRAVALSKLELLENSVLLDIGAGTGSVSVEAARIVTRGLIYAVECQEEAAALIEENKQKFGAWQIQIIRGKAPQALEQVKHGMELPTHAFIGGTSGNLKQIVKNLLIINPRIRIVINVIALETLGQAMECCKELDLEAEVVCMQVSRAKKAGSYHLMQGQNPVYIISFGGEET